MVAQRVGEAFGSVVISSNSREEVSAYTGLAMDTIYTMVSQRRIPFVKIGRLVKFDQKAIHDWIESQKVTPMPPKEY